MNPSFSRKGVLLVFLLLFSAMAAKAQLKKIVFTPQWHANVQFAGYITAREMGFYRDEGLDVTIQYPTGAKSSLDLLREGKSDLAMAILLNAIVSKSNGEIDLVNVMQTSQHSSLCLAVKTPTEDLTMEKLRGLRVGLWAANTAIGAKAMNNIYHLDWDIVPFKEGIKMLSYGVMDAISVMEYNELLRLKYTGRDVSQRSIFRMCDNDFDIPEEGVYCSSDYYRRNADAVKAFIRASKKGWEWCRQHPEEAVDIVTKEMNKEYVNNSKVFQSAGLKVVLQKQERTPGNIGYTLLQEQYDKAARTLLDAEIINIIPDFKTFIAQ